MSLAARRISPMARVLVAAGALACGARPLSAKSPRMEDQPTLAAETFVVAPAVIERIVTAARTDVSFNLPSPDRRWFVRTTGRERWDIAQYGRVAYLAVPSALLDAPTADVFEVTLDGSTWSPRPDPCHPDQG